jgi:hypothetical protein
MIEEAFVQFLKRENIEPKISDNKYKIKFVDSGKDDLYGESDEN